MKLVMQMGADVFMTSFTFEATPGDMVFASCCLLIPEVPMWLPLVGSCVRF